MSCGSAGSTTGEPISPAHSSATPSTCVQNTLDLLDELQKFAPLDPAFRSCARRRGRSAREVSWTAAREAYVRFAARYESGPRRRSGSSSTAVTPISRCARGARRAGRLGVSFAPTGDGRTLRARPGLLQLGQHGVARAGAYLHLGLSEHRGPAMVLRRTLGAGGRRARRPGVPTRAGVSPASRRRLFAVSGSMTASSVPRPAELGFSYYQASLLCEMIEAALGRPALVKMLLAYRDGQDTPASCISAPDHAQRAAEFLGMVPGSALPPLGPMRPGPAPAPRRASSRRRSRRDTRCWSRSGSPRRSRRGAGRGDVSGLQRTGCPGAGLARLARDRGGRAAGSLRLPGTPPSTNRRSGPTIWRLRCGRRWGI